MATVDLINANRGLVVNRKEHKNNCAVKADWPIDAFFVTIGICLIAGYWLRVG